MPGSPAQAYGVFKFNPSSSPVPYRHRQFALCHSHNRRRNNYHYSTQIRHNLVQLESQKEGYVEAFLSELEKRNCHRTFDIYINGRCLDAILDTGAKCSIISKELGDLFPTIPNKFISLLAVTEDRLTNNQLVPATFRLGDKMVRHPFVVVENKKFHVILGDDFCDLYKVVIKEKEIVSPVLGTLPITEGSENFIFRNGLEEYVESWDVTTPSTVDQEEVILSTATENEIKTHVACTQTEFCLHTVVPRLERKLRKEAETQTDFPTSQVGSQVGENDDDTFESQVDNDDDK